MRCCSGGDPSCTDPRLDRNGLRGLFRGRALRRQLERSLRSGPDARQEFILEAVSAAASVLELGSGLGLLALTALRKGASDAILVDVSGESLELSRELARGLRVSEGAAWIEGDAAWLEDLPQSDAVVLDRVVCCYPEADRLLRKAAGWSRDTLVFSFPRVTWWSSLAVGAGNAFHALMRREYRTFLHPQDLLLAAATSSGHELVSLEAFGVWRVAVLRRT